MGRPASRVPIALLAAVMLTVSGWGTSDGTTLARRSTAELTVLSEYVIEGTVTEVVSRFHPEHRFVYTYVTVEVEVAHKGRPGTPAVVLQELGGVDGDYRVTVPSTTEWSVGERVILFLDVKDETYFRVHGMEQGKFVVETDAGTGALVVTRPESVEETYNRSASGELDSTIDPATGTRFYDAFVRTIAAYRDRLSMGGE